VNNAGTAFATPVIRTSVDDWQRVMALNATGTFSLYARVASRVMTRGWAVL
jgi:NAD(P)-dependent dehydrogenase (short-subunit alcohol dehydrogenase family)